MFGVDAPNTVDGANILLVQAIPVSTPLITVGSRATATVDPVIRPTPGMRNLPREVQQILRESQQKAAEAAQNPRPGTPEALVPRKGESLQQYQERMKADQERLMKNTKEGLGPPYRPSGFESRWKELIDAIGKWLGESNEKVIIVCPREANTCAAALWLHRSDAAAGSWNIHGSPHPRVDRLVFRDVQGDAWVLA